MRLFRWLIFFALAAACHAQMYQGRQLVKSSLIADATAIVPGQPITVGLLLQAQPGWHTYWQYAGDAGIPTRIDWTLPPGFKAGPIQWPLPTLDNEPGDIVNYVYPGAVLLPVQIQTPPDLKPGQSVQIRAHAAWLVCADICVPGKADLSLTLPVAASSSEANASLFSAARSRLPRTGTPPFKAIWSRQGHTLLLDIQGLDLFKFIDFFPIPGDVQVGHPQVAAQSVRIPLLDPKAAPDSIGGIVVLGKGRQAESGPSKLSEPYPVPNLLKPQTGTSLIPPLSPGEEIWQLPANSEPAVAALHPSSFVLHPLLYWLTLGFIGGLILNVMPCVLPVIALKIFGFIRQAGESHRRILALGFTFIAGIFAWFLLLAGLIVGFKAAGHQLNWAFQFQHPSFVAAMVVILLLFSLNLLGVFEIVLPGRVQSVVNDAAGREGYGGTFLHGVFATLMATPCTAPFLGPALGFALAQPATVVFAMFGSIAAGMSAPYAILAIKPGWLRFLPKPGIWMVRVKQVLGVLLLVTVVWLGWVLFEQFANRPKPFPPQLAAALTKDKIVFVDFTADWCVNCKVNERLVIDSQPVQDAFKQHGVIFLKADWTNGAGGITALLRQFGRAGVPLYVIYPPGGQPIVLPEVITKDIVLRALDRAAS